MKIRLLFLATLVLLLACQDKPQINPVEGSQIILEASPLYKTFLQRHPDKVPLVWAFHDLNNDYRDDLVIIFREDGEKNKMVVILDAGENKGMATNEVPAPVSNQTITFKNIDEKPPTEFIVQGMKGTHIGYAVYRIENGTLVDLFSEGMAGCCN